MGQDRSAIAESLFEGYCRERGYAYCKHPEFANTAKHPDYLLETSHGLVVCEVKSINPEETILTGRLGARHPAERLLRQRNAIKEATEQLRPLKPLAIPLMILLYSDDVMVSLDLKHLAWAMYGDPEVHIPLSAPAEAQWVTGRNGRLRTHHQYVSAVGALHVKDLATEELEAWSSERFASAVHARLAPTQSAEAFLNETAAGSFSEGDVVWVELADSASEQCTDLPQELFDGPRDRRISPSPDRRGLIVVR